MLENYILMNQNKKVLKFEFDKDYNSINFTEATLVSVCQYKIVKGYTQRIKCFENLMNKI